MRIGLIDVDGHAKKKKWGATIYPNIALGKIARWHRQRGDTVEWYSPFADTYDVVFMSKIFNFSEPFTQIITNSKKVVFGGTGFLMTRPRDREYNIDISSVRCIVKYVYQERLPDVIDRCQPDYSIYPNVPKDYAYGFLTRGCPNQCRWCVVPIKEGAIRPYMDVDEIAIEGRHKLVLMDNNFLAAGEYANEQLEKIIDRGYRVDFNQALDARLVTDDFARQLAQVKWLDKNRIRFGCDTKAQIDDCERAMQMIISYGFHGEFFLYTMLNDNFQESYRRIHHWWERLQHARKEHLGNWVYAYAQPYRDPVNPNRSIPQWQKDTANWVNKKAHFVAHSFEEFQPRKGFRCIEYFK